MATSPKFRTIPINPPSGSASAGVEKPSVMQDLKYTFQDMPVWGWLIIAAGILMVVYFFTRGGSSSTQQQNPIGDIPQTSGGAAGIDPNSLQYFQMLQQELQQQQQLLGNVNNQTAVGPDTIYNGHPLSWWFSSQGGHEYQQIGKIAYPSGSPNAGKYYFRDPWGRVWAWTTGATSFNGQDAFKDPWGNIWDVNGALLQESGKGFGIDFQKNWQGGSASQSAQKNAPMSNAQSLAHATAATMGGIGNHPTSHPGNAIVDFPHNNGPLTGLGSTAGNTAITAPPYTPAPDVYSPHTVPVVTPPSTTADK